MRANPFAAPYVLFLFANSVRSELLGCRDIGCPQGSFGAKCPLGDFTAQSLGISKLVASSISPDPFTWTITTGNADGPIDGQSTFRKDFYFGQPPGVDLQSNSSINACAIIFEGISSSLEFGLGPSPGAADGVCTDALDEQCVSDWIAQAKSLVEKGGSELGLDCESLGQQLRNNPPGSCPNFYGTWGEVRSYPISSSQAPSPMQINGCNPTIREDYTVTHIDMFNATMPGVIRDVMIHFLGGITPVMTVFALDSALNASGQFNETNATSSQVYLNCLKTITGGDGNRSGEIVVGRGRSLNVVQDAAYAIGLAASMLAMSVLF